MIHRVLCSGLVIRVRVHSLERPLRIARLREFTCIFVCPLLSRLIVAYDLRPRGWTRDNLARKSRGNLWRSKTFRFAESRNRASGSGFGNRSIRQTIGRFRAFLSFFRRFLDSSGFRETGRNRGSRGEAGKKWRRCLRTRLSVRSDFIAGNERILGESPDSVTRLTGNSSGFYEYGVTVPLIITVWLHPGLKATLKIVIREFFLRASNFTAIFSSLFLPFCPSVFFNFTLSFLGYGTKEGMGKKEKE